jgi:serine/threonine protein phosphatase PrpC
MRDHVAEDLGAIVAVTDRGKRHHRNEDAFAIGETGDVLIGVVCDGVSTTDNPQDASLAAANSARDVLVTAITSGSTDIAGALVEAVEAAQAAASAVPTIEGGEGPASTTFVASVVVPGADDVVRTWTAWLGDSRAYWVHGDTVTQLTIDDSWAVDQIGSGTLTQDEALADPRAQSITRWLGADALDATPTIQAFEHDAGGSLLLCSDGLWKYAPTEVEMAELISRLNESAIDALGGIDLAEALVAFANECGGHDNTTVLLATHGPVTTAGGGSRNDGQEPLSAREESS